MASDDDTTYGEGYADWKRWGAAAFGEVDGATAEYYASELARAGVGRAQGLNVLELGFGNGAMLAFARAKGWNVVGIEASAPLVERARASGFDAHGPAAMEGFGDESFDLVLAFDVLEHVPQDALPKLMADVRRVLKPGGLLVARFPNGDSPLGLANQHGDPTHLTTIGSAKARFLCDAAGLVTRRLDGPARSFISRSLPRTVYNLALLPPRWLVEKAVKLLFFPQSDIKFFSSNLTLVAEKPLP